MFHAIDALLVAADAAPYERLGLAVSPPAAPAAGLRERSWAVPGCTVRLLAAGPPDHGDHPLAAHARRAAGLFAVAVRVTDVATAVADLAARGVAAEAWPDGTAWVPVRDRAGADLLLVPPGLAAVPGAHGFPLRRLDHLAAVAAADLDGTTRFWADVLGVPVAGEVVTSALVIRQLRIGDAVFELLGAATPESPVLSRPPGLVSLASWEVPDLDAAVAAARAGGFAPSEPAAGVLPGTRVASIPAPELGGVVMQLLQYV